MLKNNVAVDRRRSVASELLVVGRYLVLSRPTCRCVVVVGCIWQKGKLFLTPVLKIWLPIPPTLAESAIKGVELTEFLNVVCAVL